MDSTYVAIPDAQLKSVLAVLAENGQHSLDPQVVVLLAACIGAAAAIIPHFLLFYLRDNKEKVKLRSEIVAEERRMATLLREQYIEFVIASVNANAWYIAQSLAGTDEKMRFFYYQKSLGEDERKIKIENRIQVSLAEYFKNLALFMAVFKKDAVLTGYVANIRSFIHPEPTDFVNFSGNVNTLFNKAKSERTRLLKEYDKLFSLFDLVHEKL